MQLNFKHGKKLMLLMKSTAPSKKLQVPWMKLELIQVMPHKSLDLLLNSLVVPVELYKKMDGLLLKQLLKNIHHLHMNQTQLIQLHTHQLHITQPLALDLTEEIHILQAHQVLDLIEETLILQAHHQLHQNGELNEKY